MLYLNTRAYSLYWEISWLYLSRASVEPRQHRMPARSVGNSSVSSCPSKFPTVPVQPLSLAYKPSHASLATCFSAIDLQSSIPLCSCPPRVAEPHPSQHPPGVAHPHVSRKPPDAPLTFLIADRTPPTLPQPVCILSARADLGRSGWSGWAGQRHTLGCCALNFLFATIAQ
jgi:hypothetical protein